MTPPPPAPAAKLDAFDGIRGIAAFTVFISHLVIAFWPILYCHGHPMIADYPRVVRWLAESPTRALYDGQFSVSLFFLLSGFVLSLSYFRRPSLEAVRSAAARRYPRLMIPAAVSVVAGYLFMKWGWMKNLPAAQQMDQTLGFAHTWLTYFYNFPPSAAEAGREAVWDTFFVGRSVYNQNLWTMSVELTGSFLVYAFVAMFGTLRWRAVFYVASAAFLVLTGRFLMVDFLLGVAVADLFAVNERAGSRVRIPGWVGAGLVVGGCYVVANKYTGPLPFAGVVLDKGQLCEAGGGLMVILAAAFSAPVRRFFEWRGFNFLGKISFSLYLVHLILICSVASRVYLFCRLKAGYGHDAAGGLACGACIAASFAASWAMYLWVDRPTITGTKWVYDKVFRPAPLPAVAPAPAAAAPPLRIAA